MAPRDRPSVGDRRRNNFVMAHEERATRTFKSRPPEPASSRQPSGTAFDALRDTGEELPLGSGCGACGSAGAASLQHTSCGRPRKGQGRGSVVRLTNYYFASHK